jgi:deoxycytidylate deaminase
VERINRHLMFMEIAKVVAKRSTCARLNVGAVITVNNRIVSIGYNGPKAGADHCSPECAAAAAATGCSRSVHAEINAMQFVPASERSSPKIMYVTDSPCDMCAIKISDPMFNLQELYYGNLFRQTSLLDRIPRLYRITPSGYITDHHTSLLISFLAHDP